MTYFKIKKTEDALMQLLRLELNGVCVENKTFNDVCWMDILKVAAKQGVDALVMDAMDNLRHEQRPANQLLLPLIGRVACMEHRYAAYSNVLHEMGRIMESKDLAMLVLKGYGCNLNYSIPSHRPCGDIDIYVMDKYGNHNIDVDKYVNSVICDEGGEIVSYDNMHHSIFHYKQFVVENHHTIIDINTHSSSRRLNVLLEALAHDCWVHSKSKCGLILPDVSFNSIHLLRHMANDFATANISLRQLLDWSSFVENNCDEIDWDFVFSMAKRFNMHVFLSAINSICTDYLGYSTEHFPIEKRNDYLRDKVLGEIFYPTFQREIPPMSSWLRYCIVKTQRMWMNRWKYNIVYDDNLLSAFFFHAKNRMYECMRSLLRMS